MPEIISVTHSDPYHTHVPWQLINPENASNLAPVWKAICSRSDDKYAVRRWFMLECIKAYRWEERQTPGQKSEELLAISKKAEELSGMIQQNKQASDISDDVLRTIASEPTSGMAVALLLVSYLLEIEAEVPPASSQPNRRNAHEIVFVKRLTLAMRERFDQPLTAYVATTASVIFGKKVTKKFVENNT